MKDWNQPIFFEKIERTSGTWTHGYRIAGLVVWLCAIVSYHFKMRYYFYIVSYHFRWDTTSINQSNLSAFFFERFLSGDSFKFFIIKIIKKTDRLETEMSKHLKLESKKLFSVQFQISNFLFNVRQNVVVSLIT